MGKTKVVKKKPVSSTKKTKGKQGKKPCPKCGTLVGVRSFKCECGHTFKKTKKKTTTKSESNHTFDNVQTALTLIKNTGGIKQAKQLLDTLGKLG